METSTNIASFQKLIRETPDRKPSGKHVKKDG